MKNKWKSGIAGVAAVLIFAAGCSTTGKNEKKTESSAGGDVKQEITVNSAGKLVSLDSALINDVYSSDTVGQLFEGLYRINQENVVELGIAAEEPKVNDDQTVYTYTLRDAKWSNGDAVKASDFVYAYRKVVDPATQSTSANRFDVIKNANTIRNGKEKPENLGVKAVDDKTLEITLEAPVPYLKQLLTGTPFLPQHEATAKAAGKNYGTKSDDLVVNGAFTISEWTGTNDKWVLTKNKDYWDASTVKIEKVTSNVVTEVATGANLFEAGKADFTILTDTYVKQYKDAPEFHSVPKSTIGYLGYNTTRKVPGNVHVRKAISQAIDKEIFVKNILADGSIALNGLVPDNYAKDPENGKEFRAENGDLLAYSKEAAEKEWAEAKKELGQDKVKIEILVAEFPYAKKTAEYIQSELQKTLSGIQVEIRSVPLSNRLEDNRSGNFDFFFGTWTPDYADPVNFLEIYHSDGGLNFGKYSSKAYDAGLNEIKTTLATKPEERWQKMLDVEKIGIGEDAMITPLYQSAVNYLQSDRVEGIQIFPFGRQTSYRYAEVVK